MLRVGIEGEGRLTVTENDTAAAVGSGSRVRHPRDGRADGKNGSGQRRALP